MIIPKGWKLVPVKPTEEMLDAWFTAPRGDGGSVQDFASAYRAMLAAAPTAPAGEPEFYVEHKVLRSAMAYVGIAAPESDEELGAEMERHAKRVIRAAAKLLVQQPVSDPDGLRAAASALLEKLPTDEIGLAAFHAGDEVRALISALGAPAPDEREIGLKWSHEEQLAVRGLIGRLLAGWDEDPNLMTDTLKWLSVHRERFISKHEMDAAYEHARSTGKELPE